MREDLFEIQKTYRLMYESYFHVPENILKPIKDYYIDMYRKFLKDPTEEITDDKYPSKFFDIDFTGTNYDFLNFINPKPKILVGFTDQNNSFHSHHDFKTKKNTIQTKNRGNILLRLNKSSDTFRELLSSEIEHEVLHFIQALLSVYKNEIAGSTHSSLFGRSKDFYGSSITKAGKYSRKFKHSSRPIEFYPNLITSIRELQYLYYKRFGMIRDWKLFAKWEKPKRDFFKTFLNIVNDAEIEDKLSKNLFDNSIAVQLFKEIKNISPDFYKKILKIAYDSFVNKDRNFNPKEIENELLNIEKE